MMPENLMEKERKSTTNISSKIQEPRLEGHKMLTVPSGLLMFGGKHDDGTYSNTLWLFNFTSKVWTKKAESSNIKPKPVWLHTFTLVNDTAYVFGGSTSGGEFVSDMFRINAISLDEWEYVNVHGGKQMDLRMTAHTCVYDPKSHSLVVFGGILTDVARFSKLSRRLFMFDIDSSVWSEIQYKNFEIAFPPEMAFHSASLVGNYMLIFGGYIHQHGKIEMCYLTSLYLYYLDCHYWQ